MEKSNPSRKDSGQLRPSLLPKAIPDIREANVENLRKNYKSERTEELKEIFRMYDKVNIGYINQTVHTFT